MFNNNADFYPTPDSLINKMLSHIDFSTIKSVLEPSGGKGNIIEKVISKLKYNRSYYGRNSKDQQWDIDTIEKDENLQHILKGKGYRVVHNDFLTYYSLKKYDVIIMNPPFKDGEKHLLKAIEMQQNGGKIVCILNAETLKNPFSNTRRDLLNKLDQYNAEVEFIENAFVDAERQTYVEIALIKIDIEKQYNSTILNDLRQEEIFQNEEIHNSNTLINNDFIKGIIEQYNFEIKAGLKLIAEYNALKPYMLSSMKGCSNTILNLGLYYKDEDDSTLENSYIKQVRAKYWEALFTSEQFMGLFTSNLRQEYYNKVNELRNYDFSLYNIYTIKIELNKHMVKSVEDTILNLFDEFSRKHHYYDETSGNIHMYNGWKTNLAHKINKKVIIPLNGFRDLQYSWGKYDPTNYKVVDKLTDIEKVFNYLDAGITEDINLNEALKMAEHYQETKKIETKYFLLTFYKKGTCHIEFKNMDLLHKFNLYAARSKNWLPPSYGKVKYNDMTREEKEVVKEFEGESSYNKVMNNKNYFIVEANRLLMIS